VSRFLLTSLRTVSETDIWEGCYGTPPVWSSIADFTPEVLLMDILNSDLCLHEAALRMQCDTSIQRLDTLNHCLRTIRSFSDTFISLDPSGLSRLPFSVWLRTIHCLVVLAKLTFWPGGEGWDVPYVRSILDFSAVAEGWANKMKQAAHQHKQDPQDHQTTAHTTPAGPSTVSERFYWYVEKMWQCKRWFEAKVAAETPPSASANSPAASYNANVGVGEFSALFDGLSFNGLWFDGFDQSSWAETDNSATPLY